MSCGTCQKYILSNLIFGIFEIIIGCATCQFYFNVSDNDIFFDEGFGLGRLWDPTLYPFQLHHAPLATARGLSLAAGAKRATSV